MPIIQSQVNKTLKFASAYGIIWMKKTTKNTIVEKTCEKISPKAIYISFCQKEWCVMIKKENAIMLPLECADLNGVKLKYKVFGDDKVRIVVELALGATIGEWWHIANQYSQQYTVLLYERNRRTVPKRTPKNIAIELHELLGTIPHEEKIIIIAHSQGGLYAQQFARLYPNMINGIVLLDPLSAHDNKFKELLTPAEMKQSGVDKTAMLSITKLLAKLHLGFIIKAIMKKAPPFYYYNDFSKDSRDHILSSITKPELSASAIEEYKLSHEPQEILALMEKTDFPEIPIFLITHSKEFAISETMEFGRTTRELAEKVEENWQSIMKEYLKLSTIKKHIEATNSGHFIHLMEPKLIENALTWIETYSV